MRCPQCGTQNEPDSRFCGGCGARLQGTLAPTHKIVDSQGQPSSQQPYPTPPNVAQQAQAIARQVSAEYAAQRGPSAPMPVPPGQPSGQRSIPPQMAPGQPSAQRSIPPQPTPAPVQRPSQPQPVPAGPKSNPPGGYVAPRTTPQGGGAAIGSNSRSAAPARSAEQSFQMPKRRWGLIIVVLVFDLGLAAAGAYLLSEGLSAEPAKSAPPDPTPVGAAKPAAPPPAPAKPVDVPKQAVAPVEPVAIDAGVVEPVAAAEDDEKPQGRTPPKRRKGPKPVDPYKDADDDGPVHGPPPPTDVDR